MYLTSSSVVTDDSFLTAQVGWSKLLGVSVDPAGPGAAEDSAPLLPPQESHLSAYEFLHTSLHSYNELVLFLRFKTSYRSPRRLTLHTIPSSSFLADNRDGMGTNSIKCSKTFSIYNPPSIKTKFPSPLHLFLLHTQPQIVQISHDFWVHWNL